MVYQRLRDHLERQQTVHPNAQYVFESRCDTAIDPRNLLRRFKRALKHASLPETIRSHDLRHSCATFLIAQGEHPRVIKAILGHAQISTTLDIYGHVLPETHQTAAAKMDVLFSKEDSADTQEDTAHEDIADKEEEAAGELTLATYNKAPEGCANLLALSDGVPDGHQ
jgi:hypothetical protein